MCMDPKAESVIPEYLCGENETLIHGPIGSLGKIYGTIRLDICRLTVMLLVDLSGEG